MVTWISVSESFPSLPSFWMHGWSRYQLDPCGQVCHDKCLIAHLQRWLEVHFLRITGSFQILSDSEWMGKFRSHVWAFGVLGTLAEWREDWDYSFFFPLVGLQASGEVESSVFSFLGPKPGLWKTDHRKLIMKYSGTRSGIMSFLVS